jgi:hypothetical protein
MFAIAFFAIFLKNFEATLGFEPRNSGFADRPLSHLGTSPFSVINIKTASQKSKIVFVNAST